MCHAGSVVEFAVQWWQHQESGATTQFGRESGVCVCVAHLGEGVTFFKAGKATPRVTREGKSKNSSGHKKSEMLK